MAKKVTLKTIADALGVSQSMVSRALSDKYGVAEDMRSMIRLTALDMGYWQERQHARKMTGAVTIVINRHDFQDSQFYLKVIEEIEREASHCNMQLLLAVVDDTNDDVPPAVRNRKTDGVIVLGLLTPSQFSKFLQIGVPMVMLDTLNQYPTIDCVRANNYQGGYDATQYLIKRGHRRLCFIGASDYSYSFSERLRGFWDCVAEFSEAGVQGTAVTGTYASVDIPFHVTEAQRALMPENGVTAVFCANDPVAFQVYDIANQLGRRIPEDLSVIGFDDVQHCVDVHPKLTSVKVSKTELARQAFERLISRIRNPDAPNIYMQLATRITERESVAIVHK